nr:MAG TPA: hypothetical protein [Caudoviricetes sp.]
MERLTRKKLGSSYPLKNNASAKVGLFTDYDGFFAFFEAVNRLGEIEDILGDDYDLSRLRDLVQADRDGRCVVLPVKIGDSIYFTFLGKIIEKQVFSVVTFCNSQRIYCNGTSEFFRPDDVEKTVFLTRESAEKALKGECNNEEVYKSNS